MKPKLPVFLGFFVMGFVDIVGISTSYAKKDWQLRDSVANLLPLMVFIWFALFSIPTGMFMNRVGRRKTVLLGLGMTFVAMLVPLATSGFGLLLVAFALIGIGNTILQVSLNPLLSNVVRPDRWTSALTGGQLIKAVGLNTTLPGFIRYRFGLPLAPALQNEVSGLMIMGVAGGAVLLPVIGVIGDARGPAWAMGFLLVAWGYLAWAGGRLERL